MTHATIDLRSDTVTLPGAAMRAAMAAAEVGDDVYGEDPTVNRLEAVLAERAGMEAGLFMPTGTQSNLVALLTHCARGDEYIVGQEAHTYKYEGGGGAVLGSIQPQPLENAPDGSIPLESIRGAIKPDDSHFPKTRLIALENTIGGRVLPLSYMTAVAALAGETGLATHLDGARVFNAAIALDASLADICRLFDSVSICISKGLGAPAGSVLVGTKPYIGAARRWRKMTGGGMRQAGILAAACLYALEHHVERLAEDHANAAYLAEGLRARSTVHVTRVATNMVFIEVEPGVVAPLARHLAQCGVRATLHARTRLVTHLDVDRAALDRVIDAFASFAARPPAATPVAASAAGSALA